MAILLSTGGPDGAALTPDDGCGGGGGLRGQGGSQLVGLWVSFLRGVSSAGSVGVDVELGVRWMRQAEAVPHRATGVPHRPAHGMPPPPAHV